VPTDADDDAVIATGDSDLLVIERFGEIRILSTADALATMRED
jgi:predicted nucleic acid-binding protein